MKWVKPHKVINHVQFQVFMPTSFGGVHTDKKKENSLLFSKDILQHAFLVWGKLNFDIELMPTTITRKTIY